MQAIKTITKLELDKASHGPAANGEKPGQSAQRALDKTFGPSDDAAFVLESGMRSAIIFVVITWCGISGASAQQLSTKQRNAINHLAQVMAIENYCQDYEGNHLLLGMLLTEYKIDLDRPQFNEPLKAKYQEHFKGLQAAGTRVGCLLGWSLYGEGGQNVPGLIRRK